MLFELIVYTQELFYIFQNIAIDVLNDSSIKEASTADIFFLDFEPVSLTFNTRVRLLKLDKLKQV